MLPQPCVYPSLRAPSEPSFICFHLKPPSEASWWPWSPGGSGRWASHQEVGSCMANTRVTPCQAASVQDTGHQGCMAPSPANLPSLAFKFSSNGGMPLGESQAPSGLSFPQRPGKSGLDGLSHLPTSGSSRHFQEPASRVSLLKEQGHWSLCKTSLLPVSSSVCGGRILRG